MWSQWYKLSDKSNVRGFVIKRYRKIDGRTSWENYPAKEYRNLTPDEIDSLLRRLNAAHEVRQKEREERFAYDLAYINQKSLKEFEDHLASKADDKNHLTSSMSHLREYVFQYFINIQKIPDPSQWYKKQAKWGEWLDAKPLKTSTIVKIIGVANRFNKFIAESVYTDMPSPRKLDPIGKNKLKKRAKAETNGKTKFIPDDTWKKILKWFKDNDPEVLPNIILTEAFGLRLSESQGFSKEKFFKEYLLVSEQGDRLKYGKLLKRPVKTIDERKVPYWNMSGKDAWEQVKLVAVMHPDTLNERVNEGFHHFGHTSHDMRKRFITKALRKFHVRDVQQAAGHQDIRTTMGYAEDDREMQEELLDLD